MKRLFSFTLFVMIVLLALIAKNSDRGQRTRQHIAHTPALVKA